MSIHYYSPIQFTHQEAPWSVKNKDLSGIEWTQSSNEMQAVQKILDMAQAWALRNNRPLTRGEFGPYEKADMPSRIRWTNCIARQAELRQWRWSYWPFDSDFICFDMAKDAWVKPFRRALIPEAK